jgi:hypothetical protein
MIAHKEPECRKALRFFIHPHEYFSCDSHMILKSWYRLKRMVNIAQKGEIIP